MRRDGRVKGEHCTRGPPHARRGAHTVERVWKPLRTQVFPLSPVERPEDGDAREGCAEATRRGSKATRRPEAPLPTAGRNIVYGREVVVVAVYRAACILEQSYLCYRQRPSKPTMKITPTSWCCRPLTRAGRQRPCHSQRDVIDTHKHYISSPARSRGNGESFRSSSEDPASGCRRPFDVWVAHGPHGPWLMRSCKLLSSAQHCGRRRCSV